MTDDLALIEQLSESNVVALTLFGEARGEPIEGRIAIANVIRNRVATQRASFGLTAREVCLKPRQFSCWRPEGGSINYGVVMDAAHALRRNTTGPMLGECQWIADGAMTGQFGDTVKHATHYYSPAAMKPAGNIPGWAVGLKPVAEIHGHLFYAGVN